MSEERGKYHTTAQGTRIYNVLSPYAYTAGSGEKKTAWTEVGVAFESADGQGINVELRPSLAVSGRLVIRPRKNTGGSDDLAPAGGPKRFYHDIDDELV